MTYDDLVLKKKMWLTRKLFLSGYVEIARLISRHIKRIECRMRRHPDYRKER